MTIELLNDYLEALDDSLTQSFPPSQGPVFFIAALPRAGSTFLQQLLATCTSIGYVSNILARFWKTPYLGSMVEKSLSCTSFASSFRSEYGNTAGPLEPHEWGWFWQKWLGLSGDAHYAQEENIDTMGLARKLAAIEYVKGNSLVFDNVYTVANMDILARSLPCVGIIHLARDPFYVMNSLLNARMKRYGKTDTFYGHRPRNIDAILAMRDPVEQVAAQTRAITREIETSMNMVPASSLMRMEYSELVSHPVESVERIAGFVRDLGGTLSLRPENFSLLPAFPHRDDPALIHPDFRDRLAFFHNQYFCKTP
ncbi:MAG: sulfotransferase [Thermodesulfobacteriota bacterium]